MTFRRVMLVVLPLLGAFFVFMVMRHIYLGWEASLSPEPLTVGLSMPHMPVTIEDMSLQQRLSHGYSEHINLVRRDKQGRLEMRFLADRIIHQTKTTADIDLPRLQFFTKKNEIITLLADYGHVVTKGSLANVSDIQSGVLWGNVMLVHDRGTPDDHSDDIRVSLQDLHFNNEMSELATDGPVVLSGLEINLTARKMRMALDPTTRRINTMTFLEDIYVTLEAGDRLRMNLTAPMPEAAAPSAPAAKPAKGDRPPAADASSPLADKISAELWRIDLAGNVDARQQTQRLLCDRLSLYNRSSGGGKTTPTTTGKTPAKNLPENPPLDGAETESPLEGAAAKAAKFLLPDAPPPLTVMADGPLIITPVGEAERLALGDDQYLVEASGKPVFVDDGQTHVVGSQVRYNMKTGFGSVIGKDAPMLLEQPDRLYLTGGQLDFDRRQGIAEVHGEGQLHAQVQGDSLGMGGRKKSTAPTTPAPPAAKTAPQEPSMLDASWTRGMRLDFYRLPTDAKQIGEIKRALFHGQAVVKQKEGLLQGDELAIDFFKAEEGRGQAVERLVGHGNVLVKNEPPPNKEAPADAPKDVTRVTVGSIACQNLDMAFARDPVTGDSQAKELKASGAVVIREPQGKDAQGRIQEGRIQAEDRLTARFGPSAKGSMDAQFFEAFGKVWVDRADLHAEGDHIRRDLTDGAMLLEGRPAKAKRGDTRIEGPRIEFSQTEGRATVRGAGELEMPATSDLRGRQRATPEPLLVRWQNGMLFEDKRNFAQFDGKVRAATGGSRLDSERLWIYFADRPDTAAPVGAAAPGAGAAPAPAKTASAGKAKSSTAGADTQEFFGRKSIVRVLAEKDVLAIEQQLNPDKTLRHQLEMSGDNLTYLEENRKAYIRGVGWLRILARERPKPGVEPPPGLATGVTDATWKGAVAEGYARTHIVWTDGMAYEGTADRAYFRGNVDAVYAGRSVAGGGGAPGTAAARAGAGSRPKPATATRIKSTDLQVVFVAKPSGGPPAAAAPATATAAAKPPNASAAADATPREDRMNVEKLVADGNVQLWVDDRRGTAERMIYQRDPELIRLYRGPEDWARLWQENEASQEFGEIVARTITFEPATGRIDVVDQQTMTVAPKPPPVTKPPPRLVPGPKSGTAPPGRY